MDGVLVIDKPRGLTSHDVVAVARRCLREKRIGHTGTLDPLATGVLPLACGRATRLVRFLTASDKDYQATIRFGLTTDSYDITGTETGRSDRRPTREDVERALASLRGDYEQTPPAFSAKKIDGRRSYALARADTAVALRPVPVRVTRAEIVGWDASAAVVAVTCSAGFYVRTFAHALGELVGTGACLEALRRTRSGQFGVDESVGIDALQQDPAAAAARIVPLEGLLPGMRAVRLTPEGFRRVSHGREVNAGHLTGPGPAGAAGAPGEWLRLLDPEGRLVAVATPGAGRGSLHPSVVLI
jgi:tRNA pseudouridine55 synthase